MNEEELIKYHNDFVESMNRGEKLFAKFHTKANDTTPTELQVFEKMLKLAETLELQVTFGKILGHGDINFETKNIRINRRDAQREQIITLAHEIGHYIGYSRSIRKYGVYTITGVKLLKEVDAYRFGWHILKKVGGTHIISKHDWINSHHETLDEYYDTYGTIPFWLPNKTVRIPPSENEKIWVIFLWAMIGIMIFSLIFQLFMKK